MGGRATATFVASGMSGSPVYIDGKLAGAISLRLGQFTADPICGITPIEYMLEIPDFDNSRPTAARVPDQAPIERAAAQTPGGAPAAFLERLPYMTPIDTPLVFSGFSQQTVRQIEPMLSLSGITPVQGGSAAAGNLTAKPAPGWESALNPGE